MIKIAILGFIALIFIMRRMRWNISGLGRFVYIMGLVVVFMALAVTLFEIFGPPQYVVYTDTLGSWQHNNEPLMFAWENFRYFPLKEFAKPVLMNGELEVVQASSALAESVSKNYVKFYEIPIIGFIPGTLLLTVLIWFFSRPKEMAIKWGEALETDSVEGYRLYKAWAEGGIIRRVHTRRTRAKASMLSARSVAKAEANLKLHSLAWRQQGKKSVFLSLLKYLREQGIETLVIDVKYDEKIHETFKKSSLPPLMMPNVLRNPEQTHAYITKDYYPSYDKEAPGDKEFKAYFLNGLKPSPEHLQFLLPRIEFAESCVLRNFTEMFKQYMGRYAGNDLLEVTCLKRDDINDSDKVARLELNFGCFLEPTRFMSKYKDYFKGRTRFASLDAGVGYTKVTVDGEELSGGTTAWYAPGMLFRCKVVDHQGDKNVAMDITFPESKMVSQGLPAPAYTSKNAAGAHVPECSYSSKDIAERDIFEGAALSNLMTLFTRWMGIPSKELVSHKTKIARETVEISNRRKLNQKKMREKIEEMFGDEVTEELAMSAIEKLYLDNKEIVDQIVVDYHLTHGDTDTIELVVDLLGEALPGITADLINFALEISTAEENG